MEFLLPPVISNEYDQLRKVGFELEFSGITLDTVADMIIELFGGMHVIKEKYFRKIEHTEIGTFTLKIDTRLLNEKLYRKPFHKLGLNVERISLGSESLQSRVEEALETVASTIVPYEINIPPLPVNDLTKAELLRSKLFEHHAKGTKSSMLYAFATHINAEIPGKDVMTLLNFLRSFLILYPWLKKACEVDITRKMTVYIEPFPEDYIELVLNPLYEPDMDELMEDYHQYNPNRNRPFDLYPVFTWLDDSKFQDWDEMANVKPRPTFHYRLPNSMIGMENWSIAKEWNHWVAIEILASDTDQLISFCKEFQNLNDQTFIGFERKWEKRMEQWVKDRKLL